MTTALAFGVNINIPSTVMIENLDLGMSIYKQYLSYTAMGEYVKSKSRLLLVTTYNRAEHNFDHFLVVTDSFVPGDMLNQRLPGNPMEDWRGFIVDGLQVIISAVGEAIHDQGCSISGKKIRWMILESDD